MMKLNKNSVEAIINRPNGITLIALVITIVVLIILAGVAINLTLGENGIFNKAKQAKEQYKMAEVKEKVELAILDIQSEKLSKNEQCTIDTIISELPGKISGLTISKDGDNAKGTYNGCDFTITPDLKVTVDGYNPSAGGSGNSGGNTPINPPTPPAPTTYSVTFNGSNVTSNGANSVEENATYTATLTATTGYSITSITVTMGGTTLAENTGYTYSSGNLSIPNVSGNIAITAVGNVPAPYDTPYTPTGFTHIGTEDWNSGYRISDTGDETGNIFVWVPCVLDQGKVKAGDTVQTFQKTTTGKYNSNSLGLSPTATSVTDVDPTNAIKTSVGTYGGFYIAAYEAGIAGTEENYSLSTKTATDGSVKPLSKAGKGVWNYITRADALTVASKMVDPSTTGVKSGLISGECWDTTLQWMVNSSTNATANAGYDTSSSGKGWYSDVSSNTRHTTGYKAVNNIYDMAGNVYEWTTENCTNNGRSYLVNRGGDYYYSGSDYPAAFRYSSNDYAYNSFAFRVVLYK